MLKDRIVSTLRFFDLQDLPLTLLELHRYLLAGTEQLRKLITPQWELVGSSNGQAQTADVDSIIKCLDEECSGIVEQKNGFYCLAGRASIIDRRLANYLYGIRRERRIKKYIGGLRYLPFVRGAALAGSQAMGQQKQTSDIDLLIIVDPQYLWLARTAVTAYFQILGKRRHGKRVADRFCLNHYFAGVKNVNELRNLYTAWEYAKLRPLVYSPTIIDYQQKNAGWIREFFPNFEPFSGYQRPGPGYAAPAYAGRPFFEKEGKFRGGADAAVVQKISERLLSGGFGRRLEQKLKSWQLPNIRQEEFILVREDELSFHPQSKQKELLEKFFTSADYPVS